MQSHSHINHNALYTHISKTRTNNAITDFFFLCRHNYNNTTDEISITATLKKTVAVTMTVTGKFEG